MSIRETAIAEYALSGHQSKRGRPGFHRAMENLQMAKEYRKQLQSKAGDVPMAPALSESRNEPEHLAEPRPFVEDTWAASYDSVTIALSGDQTQDDLLNLKSQDRRDARSVSISSRCRTSTRATGTLSWGS